MTETAHENLPKRHIFDKLLPPFLQRFSEVREVLRNFSNAVVQATSIKMLYRICCEASLEAIVETLASQMDGSWE
jgi:hypothetical protein